QERVLAALVLERLDPIKDVLGCGYRFLRNFGNDVTRLDTPFGGSRILGDVGDDHTGYIGGNAEFGTYIVAEFADRHAKHRRGFNRLILVFGASLFRILILFLA